MFSFHDLGSLLPPLLQGAWVTVTVSLVSYLIALVSGLAIGLARISKVWPVRMAAAAYVQFIRGTPLLLQLFFIYYVLPYAGIVFSPFEAGVIGLSINYSAYMAEVFRSGIAAVPRGQSEAGMSLALSHFQMMLFVIIPQALRIVVLPIGNFFVSIFKDSALVSVITMKDLMFSGEMLASSTFRHFEIFSILAVIYFLLSYPAAKLVEWIEKRLNGERRFVARKAARDPALLSQEAGNSF